MAELIELKKEEFFKALIALQTALAAEGDPAIIRDSVLMRFSFTSEIAWKAVRLFVAERGGKEALVPKAAWRELRRLELISAEETEVALAMVDDRNRLSHDYSATFAQTLYERVKGKYEPLLRKAADTLH